MTLQLREAEIRVPSPGCDTGWSEIIPITMRSQQPAVPATVLKVSLAVRLSFARLALVGRWLSKSGLRQREARLAAYASARNFPPHVTPDLPRFVMTTQETYRRDAPRQQ